MQQPLKFQQSATSGIFMKPSASSFDANAINKEVDVSIHPQNTYLSEEPGLLNEDAKLEIQADDYLLAQTSFEYMGLDPRFVQALYFFLRILT